MIPIPIGRVHELARYPVKSMAGTVIESAQLGWHGIAGDRRLAFRRLAVGITAQDERCVMVNIDPDTGEKDARVMKAVVRLNSNNAGVYGTVVCRGQIHVGQTVSVLMPDRAATHL